MGKYRKIPVEIEAIQLTKRNIKEIYEFVTNTTVDNKSCRMAQEKWDEYEIDIIQKGFPFKTLESDGETQIASIGDYIIKGVKGEFYPCKPDIFKLTYEAV